MDGIIYSVKEKGTSQVEVTTRNTSLAFFLANHKHECISFGYSNQESNSCYILLDMTKVELEEEINDYKELF